MRSARTLLVALAHPDDEVGAAGTILAHRERGDRVVVLWLTRGEMASSLASLSVEEVIRRRMEDGAAAGELLGVETRFLDFPDARLVPTPEAATRVARVVAEVRPSAVITWGDGWLRGARHPDHQACGRIVRDAITLARLERVVEPATPHRSIVPVFTYRDVHSRLPAVALDVEKHRDRILELGALYRERVGFGDRDWIEQRLRGIGARWGLRYAEEFDAWETQGGLRSALFPAEPVGGPPHPEPTASTERT